jgi:polyhydroxyalkanoate synthesis regulator protein
MREAMAKTFGQMFPFAGAEQTKAMEDMVKNNMAMFQRAMEMFYAPPAGRNGGAAPASPAAGGEAEDERNIEGLRREINALKQQLDTLAKKSD